MATEKYIAGAASDTTILGSELDSLADGAYTAAGTELANQTNKDTLAVAELSVDFVSAPTADSTCELYQLVSRTGTGYPDGGSGVAPSALLHVGTFVLRAVTTAQVVLTAAFRLGGPFKHKFILRNRSGQAFPSSGSTVKITTFNRDVT